jgi:hypothetical protein
LDEILKKGESDEQGAVKFHETCIQSTKKEMIQSRVLKACGALILFEPCLRLIDRAAISG